MQLTRKNQIRGALASATCTLLGNQLPAQAHASDDGWKIDTAVLSYSEKNRVSAVEPSINAQKTFSGDEKLNIHLVLDTLSGPSPNGAAPTDTPQTFSGPSGNKTYTVSPGDIPLDNTFKDERVAAGFNWDAPLDRVSRYNAGMNISTEHDYTSIAFSGGYTHDFFKKNTTLALSGALAFDTIHPEGGVSVPLSATNGTSGNDGNEASVDESKTVTDIVAGLTQVLDPNTLLQLNISLSMDNGYLNDPYKVVSVVDSITGRPSGIKPYLYESRPDKRTKIAYYIDLKHHFDYGDTVDMAYRYMSDDWGIQSKTMDVSYRWNMDEAFYVQPLVRYYEQTQADFFRHSLLNNEPLPDYASADTRLSAFSAKTVGIKFGYMPDPDSEVSLRFENYTQAGNDHPADATGVQKNLVMFPELKATIVQLGYSYAF